MEFQEQLLAAVRKALARMQDVREVRMFGGTGFMLNGNLVVAASKRGLLARVGADREDEALARPAARPMVMRGRRMTGYVYVDPAGLGDEAVRDWVRRAAAFVGTLPAKAAEKSTRSRRR